MATHLLAVLPATIAEDRADERAELHRLRALRKFVRQWVRDAYACGLVPDEGEGREWLDELAVAARVGRPAP